MASGRKCADGIRNAAGSGIEEGSPAESPGGGDKPGRDEA